MKYIVVRSTSCDTLVREVNARISEGYEPLGGIAVVSSMATMGYYQAMVKV